MVIDQDALHFEICLFAVLLIFKFNEGVLEAVTSPFISNDLARENSPEPAENQFEIFIMCDWVQLADKENIFWRLDFRKREISNHFKSQRLGSCLALSSQLLHGSFIHIISQLFIVGNPDGSELGFGRSRTFIWHGQARRVIIRVFQYDGMAYAYILQRSAIAVGESIVNFFECIEPFHNRAKGSGLAVQGVDIIAKCYDELATGEPLISIFGRRHCRHTNRAALSVF